jgi:hypothetical protein
VHSKGDNFNPEKKKPAKKPFTLKVILQPRMFVKKTHRHAQKLNN